MLSVESKCTISEDSLDAREVRLFKVLCFRNRRVGTWAAGIMNMSPADSLAYASSIVALGQQSRGESAIVERLTRDFSARRVKLGPERILEELGAMLLEAESDYDAYAHEPPPAQAAA